MNRSLAIILLVIICCGSLELLQARSVPLPDGPHRRYVRRRVSRNDPDLEIVEVRNVYFVRRPKKVVTHPIGEEEMDKRMRCDFEPHRSECKDLGAIPAPQPTPPSTTPISGDSMDRRIRCDFDPTADDCKTAAAGTQPPPRSTTRATTTTRSTTRATTTTSSTTPATTTTTTTTTDLPLLPELTDPEEVEVEEVVEEQTTTEADYHLPEEDDDYIDGDEKGDDGTGPDADADEGATDEPDEEDDFDTDPGDGNIGPLDDDSVWNSR
ncbi:eukaryotic translation initiation factor 4 gamma [Drosophila pseudoobscura]|uniref:Eukaryotic translation initiation factor 4 gamma n=1 Tax=Drosophila pseudoobscura pseudoobscura TaxID=46245 RepID=A0A6I8V044_DROPS|nr:eukaryotic translation initiation factor 4 gamma [Drosophila pseudoobscura]